MNKFLLLLLFAFSAQAQIVNIPDANFKSSLISFVVDTNMDGEIQYSEAASVTSLNLNDSGIYDLTGIEAFVNLEFLNLMHNDLTTLDVSALTSLEFLQCDLNYLANLVLSPSIKFLKCDSNELTNLDVTQLYDLQYLSCTFNQLNALDLSWQFQLEELSCQDNHLTMLDVGQLTALTKLTCDDNNLTSLNVGSLVNLTELTFAGNQISSIELANLTNLMTLRTADNPLGTLDVTPLVNLTNLKCYNNQLTSLDVTPLTNLSLLQCGSNPFTTLDVSTLVNLHSLDCGGTQITSLDLSALTNVTSLKLRANQFTTLDVSALTALTSLDCRYNTLLESLYMKNGKVEALQVSDNPLLTYICADESQIAAVQALVPATTLVSTYCSFVPGGNYNSVTGTVRFDSDNNGCTSSDPIIPYGVRIDLTNGSISSATFSGTDGSYALYSETGDHTMTTQLENPGFFNITPASATFNFPTLSGLNQVQDFCLTANGIHPDVEIVIVPVQRANPGFDAIYKVIYRNKGNQVQSGDIVFGFDDSAMDFVSAIPVQNSISGGSITFLYANLLPFETRSVVITLNANGPMEIPPLNIGDTLFFSATISPLAGDDMPGDNVFSCNETVVGSFDPNDKICLEGNNVSPEKIGNYLHYVINFENTGTAAAQNIVVKDVIDSAKFEISTLQVLEASHSMQTRITGDKIEFIFENIQLGESQHGNIVFKIKTKSDLAVGTTVTNNAEIFFDYNFPIITNTASTTFQVLGIPESELNNALTIYPNPASSIVNVVAKENFSSVQIFDGAGRIVSTHLSDSNEIAIDVSELSQGIYYLKVTGENVLQLQKLVKD